MLLFLDFIPNLRISFSTYAFSRFFFLSYSSPIHQSLQTSSFFQSLPLGHSPRSNLSISCHSLESCFTRPLTYGITSTSNLPHTMSGANGRRVLPAPLMSSSSSAFCESLSPSISFASKSCDFLGCSVSSASSVKWRVGYIRLRWSIWRLYDLLGCEVSVLVGCSTPSHKFDRREPHLRSVALDGW